MADAIEESTSQADLLAVMDVVFQRFILSFGHNSFSDRQLNKDFVKAISTGFKDKVADLKENEALESLVKFSVDTIFDGLVEILNGVESLNSDAAICLLKVLEAIFGSYEKLIKEKDLSFTHNVELALVPLSYFLLDEKHPTRFSKDFDELVWNLAYKTLNVKSPNFKAFINEDLKDGRFMFLGKLAEKEEVLNHLVDMMERKAINDKVSVVSAERSLMYF
jgi:hypothetical protein